MPTKLARFINRPDNDRFIRPLIIIPGNKTASITGRRPGGSNLGAVSPADFQPKKVIVKENSRSDCTYIYTGMYDAASGVQSEMLSPDIERTCSPARSD